MTRRAEWSLRTSERAEFMPNHARPRRRHIVELPDAADYCRRLRRRWRIRVLSACARDACRDVERHDWYFAEESAAIVDADAEFVAAITPTLSHVTRPLRLRRYHYQRKMPPLSVGFTYAD